MSQGPPQIFSFLRGQAAGAGEAAAGSPPPDLLQLVANHLQLGQWEQARAAMAVLAQSDSAAAALSLPAGSPSPPGSASTPPAATLPPAPREQLRALLQLLATQPQVAHCACSPTGIRSDHHLAWLCIQEYQRIFEEALPRPLVEAVELNVLLFHASDRLSDATMAELQRYHASLEAEEPAPSQLAAAAVSDLETLLEQDAVLGAVLVQAVAGRDKHEIAERRGDPSLRPRLLRKQIQLLHQHLSQHQLSAALTQLSLIDLHHNELPAEEAQRTIAAVVDQLLPRQSELNADRAQLQAAMCAVLSEHSTYLAELLNAELRQRVAHTLDDDHALRQYLRSARGAGNSSAAASAAQPSDFWSGLLLYITASGSVATQRLLSTAQSCVREDDLEALKVLLSLPPVQPLAALILATCWPLCDSKPQQAAALLQLLKPYLAASSAADSTLRSFVSLAEHQLRLSEWCAVHTPASAAAAAAAASDGAGLGAAPSRLPAASLAQGTSVTALLTGLIAPASATTALSVFSRLQRPRPPADLDLLADAASLLNSTSAEQQQLDALAAALASSANEAPAPDALDESVLDLLRRRPCYNETERRALARDLVLVHAALCLKQALVALQVSAGIVGPLTAPATDTGTDAADLMLLHSQQEALVAAVLERAKDHLNSVSYMPLRVELLENLFSFLFMTDVDLAQPYSRVGTAHGQQQHHPLFLAQPDFIQGLCNLLKDQFEVLAAISAAEGVKDELGLSAYTTVTVEDWRSRQSKLESVVAETQWRFNLVRATKRQDLSTSTTWDSGVLSAPETRAAETHATSKASHPADGRDGRKSQQLNDSDASNQTAHHTHSEESGMTDASTTASEDAAEDDDNDETSDEQEANERDQHQPRTISEPVTSSASVLAKALKSRPRLPVSLIPFMLAPPATLLTTCIKCGEFERAQQVIDMFHIENAAAQDARFGQQLAEISSRLSRGLNFGQQLDELLVQLQPLDAAQICLDLASTSTLKRDACQALLNQAADLLESATADAGTNPAGGAPEKGSLPANSLTSQSRLTSLSAALTRVQQVFAGSPAALSTVLLRPEAPLDEDGRNTRRLRSERAMAEEVLLRALHRTSSYDARLRSTTGTGSTIIGTAGVSSPLPHLPLASPGSSTPGLNLLSNSSHLSQQPSFNSPSPALADQTSPSGETLPTVAGLRAAITTLLGLYAGSEAPENEAWRPVPALFLQLETMLASLAAQLPADSHALTMLDESPTRLLARMANELRLPLVQVEELAQRMSLDLQLVLQRASCNRLALPAAALPGSGPSSQPHSALARARPSLTSQDHLIVMNDPQVLGTWLSEDLGDIEKQVERLPDFDKMGRGPTACIFTHYLLEKLCESVHECLGSDQQYHLLSDHVLHQLRRTVHVQQLLLQSAALTAVDLTLLSESERQCTFANLCNLLRLQACIVAGSPLGRVERIAWSQRVGFRLQGLGAVSLFELQQLLLFSGGSAATAKRRAGQQTGMSPSFYPEDGASPALLELLVVPETSGLHVSGAGALLTHKSRQNDTAVAFETANSDSQDPTSSLGPQPGATLSHAKDQQSHWQRFSVTAPDPNLVFALWDGTVSSPNPMPLLPATLQSSLQTARTQYLLRNVDVQPGSSRVRLPELLRWHAGRLGLQPSSAAVGIEQAAMAFATDHLPAGSRRHSLLRSVVDVTIEFVPHRWQPCFWPMEAQPIDHRRAQVLTISNEAMAAAFFPPLAAANQASMALSPAAEEYLRVRDAAGYSLAMMLAATLPGGVGASDAVSLSDSASSSNVSAVTGATASQQAAQTEKSSLAGDHHLFHSYLNHVRQSVRLVDMSRLVETRFQPLMKVAKYCGKNMPLNQLQALLFHDDRSPLRAYAAHRLLDELVAQGQLVAAVDLMCSGVLPLHVVPDDVLCAAALTTSDPQSQRRLTVLISDKLLAERLAASLAEQQPVDVAIDAARHCYRHLSQALKAAGGVEGGQHSQTAASAAGNQSTAAVSANSVPATPTKTLLSVKPASVLDETSLEILQGAVDGCAQRLRRLHIYAQLLAVQSSWKSWSNIAQLTQDQPQKVLQDLLSRRAFALARDWADAHNMVDRVIDAHYVAMLLQDDKLYQAHQALEALPTADAIAIAWDLVAVSTGLDLPPALMLPPLVKSETASQAGAQKGEKKAAAGLKGASGESKLSSSADKMPHRVERLHGLLFLLQFLLDQDSSAVSETRRQQLRDAQIGVGMLLRLPAQFVPHYWTLAASPSRLLEQLLMNRELTLAQAAVQRLSAAQLQRALQMDGQGYLSTEDRGEIAVAVRSRSTSRVPGGGSSKGGEGGTAPNSVSASPSTVAGAGSGPDNSRSSPFSDSGPLPAASVASAPLNSTRRPTAGGKSILDNVVGLPASAAARLAGPAGGAVGAAASATGGGAGGGGGSVVGGGGGGGAAAAAAAAAARGGGSTSDEGGSGRKNVDLVSFYARRALRFPTRPRGSSVHSISTHNNPPDLSSGPGAAMAARMLQAENSGLASSGEPRWLAALSETDQAQLRTEFRYEGAPSTTLCLAIMDLQRDPVTCGKLCVQLSSELSARLVADPEMVDHALAINGIRQLLFHGKVKFAQVGDASQSQLCDNFLAYAELLRILMVNKCERQHLVSLEELATTDKARRLRDALIEDNQFSLAMEVATKCQLETRDVWAAWGLAQLRGRDFEAAREKLKHALSSAGASANQSLLTRIVDVLGECPAPTLEDIGFIQSQIQELQGKLRGKSRLPGLQNTPTASPAAGDQAGGVPGGWYPTNPEDVFAVNAVRLGKVSMESNLDSQRFFEGQYYLKTYGTADGLLTYYVRHGQLPLALNTILQEKLEPTTFVNGVFIPMLKKEKLAELQEQMRDADKTLRVWTAYLNQACKYLFANGLIAVLYRMQVFMGDDVRAGLSSVRFAVGPNLSFEDRIIRYEQARRHFEAALAAANNQQKPGGKDVPSVVPPPSISDAKMLLLKLDWQMLAAKTLRGRADMTVAEGADVSVMELSFFDAASNQQRLCVELLWQADQVVDMFKTVYKILETFQLQQTPVYSEACYRLATLNAVDRLDELLRCIKSVLLPQQPDAWDEVLSRCYRVFHSDLKQPRLAGLYINQMERDHNKITALIAIGQLRDAFKTAIKSENKVAEVKRVRDAAGESDKGTTLKKCEDWLERYANGQDSGAND